MRFTCVLSVAVLLAGTTSFLLRAGESKETDIAALRATAEQGDAEAQYRLGDAYDSGRGTKANRAEALKWYLKSAEQGNVKAQFMVANIYDAKDKAEALKWYRKAAENGDSSAQLNIGVRYAIGKDAPKDIAEGAKWLYKAGEQGHSIARYYLCVIYANGKDVPRNAPEEAQKHLAEIEKELTPGQKAEGDKLAKQLQGAFPKMTGDPLPGL